MVNVRRGGAPSVQPEGHTAMTAIMTAIKVLRVASVAAVATAGVACSPIVGPKPGFDPPAVPATPTFPPLGERLDGQVTAAQPVLTIPVPASAFRPRRSDNLDQLAGAVLPATSFNAAPLGGALQTVLEDAGVGLVFTDLSAAERLVTVALPRGTVHEQVAALCSAGRAWCSAAQGGKRVEVATRATFVVELPPLPASSSANGSMASTGDQGTDSSASRIGGARTLSAVDYGQMEATLKTIVGDAKIDRAGRTIVYKATLDEATEAGAYFDQLKRNNALILTETIIAEVSFNTSNKVGIHWNRLQARIGGGLNIALGGGPAQLTSSAVGVSGIYEGDRLTTGVLLDFLATEGVINSIQAPELTALSGTPTTFTAGGRQRFVTQVGFPTSAVGSTSGVTINNVANNTVSTESLSLGLNLTLKPYYYAGIIHADVLMELVDLLRTDTVPTGSTVIQNPVTANRNLSSFVMMRPGQALLLAGIRKKRSDGNAEGLPSDVGGVSAPLLTGAGVEQTELVILMRPRVVVFVETPDDAHATPPRTPSHAGPSAPPTAPPLKLGRAGDGAVSETLAMAPLIGARTDPAPARLAVVGARADGGARAVALARAAARAVVRDLGPWVARAHLRVADAGLSARAPVSETRADGGDVSRGARRATGAKRARAVERDLGPWVARAHLRVADAGLSARAPVSEARATDGDVSRGARRATGAKRARADAAPARLAVVGARADGGARAVALARAVERDLGPWVARAHLRVADAGLSARAPVSEARAADGDVSRAARRATGAKRARADAAPARLAVLADGGARAVALARAASRAVERDLRPWVARAHLRVADAGLSARAPVSEARAGSFPEDGAENDLSSDSSVTRMTATAALDDGEMLRARWVDRLPVEPNSLTLAQADGRATSLMPVPTRSGSADPAAATIAVQTLPQLEPLDKTVDLGTVEQGRAQKLLAVWRNGGGRTVRARAPEVIADPETIVTVTADGCSDRDVLPGATCAMKIDVIGKRRGPLRASVSLAHDDGVAAMAIKGTVEDAMQRWATAGPTPKDLEPSTRELRFGVLAAQRAIVLSNRWDSPLAIGQVKLVGGEQAGVAVADDGCSQTDALKPGQNCVIVLRYRPPAVSGEVAADLIVTHAGPTRQLAIAVFGKGDGDESGDRAPAPGEVALLPVPASVMRVGNSDEGTPPSPASFQRASSLAGRQGLRLVGVREDKRLIDDNGTTRLIGAGLVTLAGRTWQASLGKDSVRLAPVMPSGSVGETVELLLGSFGGGGRPGVAK
jgi:hypothetical protein